MQCFRESKNVTEGTKTGFKTIAVNTSKFDPVLSEVIYKCFCVKNSCILDPFAGGVTRGGVAVTLGHTYHGFDVNQNQIVDNVDKLSAIGLIPNYYCDTSENVSKYFNINTFDLLFSCPPYFNLERYTDNPNDISTINDYSDFKTIYFKIINECCKLLKPNRFAVFVVGDVRDKTGKYCNFVGDTISTFIESGLHLYNSVVLLEQCGTKAMTCERPFLSNRKLAKVHQNVLIFYKGDMKKIKQIFKGTFK